MLPSSASKRILVVEDDPDLSHLTRMTLEEEGYAVAVARDGDTGCEEALSGKYDLLLIDLMLPGKDGLEICRLVRNGPKYTPVIVLTARGSEVERVVGLELGADDYLAKPVSLRELVARVKALFRRIDAFALQRAERADDRIERGQLFIDTTKHQVRLAGEPVELTAKEYELLVHFASHPGRVFTRDDLVDSIWGPGYTGYEHTVNSHINRLRQKINLGGPRQRFIETVWGVGYRFTEEPEGVEQPEGPREPADDELDRNPSAPGTGAARA